MSLLEIKKNKLEYVSALALLIIYTPFFILCFFSHPFFIDDYHFADKVQNSGLINAFLDWYNNWTGRYSLCFLMSLNFYFITNLFLYRAIIFLLIALLPILLYFLFKTFFREQSIGFYSSCTALFSFLYIYQLPSINEGLYWMTGAIAYQLPVLCLLVIFILLFNIHVDKGNRRINCFISSFLAIVLIGTNEISMVILDVFLFLIIVYRLWFGIKNNQPLFVIFVVCIVASFFVIQAPGNYVRGELFPLANDWKETIQMTFLGLGYYMFQWIGMSCLVAIIIFFVFDKAKVSFSELFSIPPIWSMSIFILVLLAGFFVPAWSTGQMPNPRAINVLFSVFAIGFFYHISLFYHQFHTHKSWRETGKIGVLLISCSIFFITFSSSKTVNNNIKTAYKDILLGRAYHFDRSMIKLYKQGWNDDDFHLEDLPASISWEISEDNYKGYPEKYFKANAK